MLSPHLKRLSIFCACTFVACAAFASMGSLRPENHSLQAEIWRIEDSGKSTVEIRRLVEEAKKQYQIPDCEIGDGLGLTDSETLVINSYNMKSKGARIQTIDEVLKRTDLGRSTLQKLAHVPESQRPIIEFVSAEEIARMGKGYYAAYDFTKRKLYLNRDAELGVLATSFSADKSE